MARTNSCSRRSATMGGWEGLRFKKNSEEQSTHSCSLRSASMASWGMASSTSRLASAARRLSSSACGALDEKKFVK